MIFTESEDLGNNAKLFAHDLSLIHIYIFPLHFLSTSKTVAFMPNVLTNLNKSSACHF